MTKIKLTQAQHKAVESFRRKGGTLRTKDALRLGIHPGTLYQLRNYGLISAVTRGIYRLNELPPLSNPDFIAVAMRVPKAVICLISALSFHNLTTQIPHEVFIALTKGDRPPALHHPPVRVFWFSRPAHETGIETRKSDEISFKIYSPEKTIADCFQFRNKIGADIAIEALRSYMKRSEKPQLQKLIYFARICRVERILRPYIEAML